jgi:short-subunit dehydrogenase
MRLKMKKNDVVVITGATAGVGRATAIAFAKRGAKVGLLARGIEGLESTYQDIISLGGKALICQADVAHFPQVEESAEKIEKEWGPIDIWVNNAMATVFSPFKEVTPEEFKRATEVTYLGTVHGTMAALKHMVPRNQGTIIQVSSALAYRSIPLQAPYCGAKHAVKGFTDSLRSELIHDKSAIYITMVHLPAVNTPQFEWGKSKMPHRAQPVPPIYQPEICAKAIVWAAYHKRREVFLGWPAIKAVLGQKLIPGYLDHYLSKHGYKDQQTDEPALKDSPFNLFESVPGLHRTHGRFDHRSKNHSLQLWMLMHGRIIFMSIILLIFFIYGVLWKMNHSR